MRSLYGLLARKYGPRVDGATRRQFLQATLVASAGILISRLPGSAFAQVPSRKPGRVAVIGAGFSGLACAHELLSAGYDVTVIEAQARLGGRVISFNDANKNALLPGRNVEGGGELIGSNHPTWVAYKEKFGLEFLDVTESEAEAPIFLDGKKLSAEDEEKLWKEMEEVCNRLNEQALKVNPDEPWTAADAVALDRKTTKSWIDALDVSPLCKAGVYVQFMANNGQDPVK